MHVQAGCCKSCRDCVNCLDLDFDRISDVIYAANVVLGKEASSIVDTAEWGYDCGTLSSDEKNRLGELTRSLENYMLALRLDGAPCLCAHEAQAVIEKILDITGVQYCVSDVHADYIFNEEGVTEFIAKNPNCVTDEIWCSNLVRICPSFTPEIVSQVDEKAEIRKLIEIMAVANPRQCDATYELIVEKDAPERCDLAHRIIVEKDEVACKIAAIISVIAELCPINADVQVTPVDCQLNMEFLAEKLECKQLPVAYVEAIQCGIVPNLIVQLIECGADLKMNGQVPIVSAYGNEITITEECTLFDLIVSKQ